MTDWTVVFLGLIALSVVTMAAIQVGALIYGARLARRLDRLTTRLEHEAGPVFAHLQTASAEAARASALAAAQVDRADRLFAQIAGRLEESATLVHSAVAAPAREGAALLSALRAAVLSLRGRPRGRARAEEDDQLFIG